MINYKISAGKMLIVPPHQYEKKKENKNGIMNKNKNHFHLFIYLGIINMLCQKDNLNEMIYPAHPDVHSFKQKYNCKT